MYDDGATLLVKKVLSEQIKEKLIEDLMYKKFVPGDKIIESTLAKRFGVSQAPVREALKGLREMGFITIEPYKGATVRLMSKEEIWETLTVRASLESVAAGIAAQKITPKEIEELEQLVVEMTRAAEAGDRIEREAINVQLHNKIMEISGHKLIIRLSNSLMFANWSQTTGTYTTLDPLELARRHKALIDPLKNHDSAGAEKAMREHIELSARSMLKSMQEE